MGRHPDSRSGVLGAGRLDKLVQALRTAGFTVHAPVLDHGALVIRPIDSAEQLPRGALDQQDAGTHRLRMSGDRYFDYTVPADSWKRLLFPPRLALWQAALQGGEVQTAASSSPPGPMALFGVRPCDVAAIRVQDRVFLGGAHPDTAYRERRERSFIVAVNCTRSTSTCFCTSMGTGPRARDGHDLALTELRDGRFLVEAGSVAGAQILSALPAGPAGETETAEAEEIARETAAGISRTMPPRIAQVLTGARESARWQAIADRCLACGNCTLVCPTCFCTAVEHTTDLAGVAHQDRRWDSCFTAGHSYIHGGSVRRSTGPRYRQWLTHKLSTWHEQFGTSGCTGCGRCIAWCPVAIDITAEAHAFAADANGGRT